MTPDQLLALFLEMVPSEYPRHMLCFFAANAAKGNILPFTTSLLSSLSKIDDASPGYAREMVGRIAAIRETGEGQYEALLEILAEIYVTAGAVEKADREEGKALFRHEPGPRGMKNPEFEVRFNGHWCAIEVKTPRLIQHGRKRGSNPWQIAVRLPKETTANLEATLPRDNPVKDFLISAEEKFTAYEAHRGGALRILVIVWDDFCNEPIAALTSSVSGLLTERSFLRAKDDTAITFTHVDGIVVIRHQHQIIRATRGEPLIDGVTDSLHYRHEGFPPKAFIAAQGGRAMPEQVMDALNAVPLANCIGAEYHPVELIMWLGGGS